MKNSVKTGKYWFDGHDPISFDLLELFNNLPVTYKNCKTT